MENFIFLCSVCCKYRWEIAIVSGLGVKPGVKLLDLNDKMVPSLRNKLSEVNWL